MLGSSDDEDGALVEEEEEPDEDDAIKDCCFWCGARPSKGQIFQRWSSDPHS